MMDFNGDYLQDLILSEQESLTVYLQKADGKFFGEPSITYVFPVRPSGKESDVNNNPATITTNHLKSRTQLSGFIIAVGYRTYADYNRRVQKVSDMICGM